MITIEEFLEVESRSYATGVSAFSDKTVLSIPIYSIFCLHGEDFSKESKRDFMSRLCGVRHSLPMAICARIIRGKMATECDIDRLISTISTMYSLHRSSEIALRRDLFRNLKPRSHNRGVLYSYDRRWNLAFTYEWFNNRSSAFDRWDERSSLRIANKQRRPPCISDVIYCWEDDDGNVKIGITNSNSPELRPKNTARKRGTNCKNLIYAKVENAREIEMNLLSRYSKRPYTSGDGYTEFRALSTKQKNDLRAMICFLKMKESEAKWQNTLQ